MDMFQPKPNSIVLATLVPTLGTAITSGKGGERSVYQANVYELEEPYRTQDNFPEFSQ